MQCSSSANRFSSLSHHQKTDQLQRQTTENFYSSSPTYFPVSYNSIDYTIKTTPNLAQVGLAVNENGWFCFVFVFFVFSNLTLFLYGYRVTTTTGK